MHRAAELCKLLEERCPGLEIKLNPSKVWLAPLCQQLTIAGLCNEFRCYTGLNPVCHMQPRKGSFEIQDQTGKIYVSLLVSFI